MSCYDYVIKNGKFIGEFEKMYQEYNDPWGLKTENLISYSRNDTIQTINRFGLKKVVELGCGLGFSLAQYAERCKNVDFTGIDISETAIQKAKASFPTIDFKVGEAKDIFDILDISEYDGIIFGEIMWYILDDLDGLLNKLLVQFKGLIIVNQVFYTEGIQQYGRNYFTNQEELVDYIKMKPLVMNCSKTIAHETSYETHTVFLCGE